jgi:hypothetical protein
VTPRRIAWSFPADGPRHWFGGSPALTRFLDTYTLLVPDNERYYVRVLGRCAARIADPARQAELRRFVRQEMLHGQGHSRYWDNLAASGLPVGRKNSVRSDMR